jgi:uncharacterized membrane protein YphA (DoxX/SURF4 family)
MTDLTIPLQVLYAGLAGTVLALIVATIQNRWSPKVFFILALRLAIGWHFLFEGLHKIHSHYVGPSETNKVFSSEMYFAAADGPLGPEIRRRINDVDAQLAARLTPQNVPPAIENLPANARADLGPGSFTPAQYAAMAPPEVAREWNAFVATFGERYKLNDEEKKKLDGITTESMAEYARWVVGVEPRNSTVKFVSGDTPLTAPQRLEYIRLRQEDVNRLGERANADLGTGHGHEMARLKDAKALVSTAKVTLVTDADAFLKELEKSAFTEIMAPRFTTQAPLPSKALDTTEKFAAVLPPPKAPEPVTFDALPEPVRKAWDAMHAAAKNAYPDDAAETIDAAYALAKVRVANWYFDRDEFSGLPKPGFGVAVKKYRDAQERAKTMQAVSDAIGEGTSAAAGGFLDRLLQAAARAATDDIKFNQDVVLAALDGKYADLRKQLELELPSGVKDGPTATPPTVNKTELNRLDWVSRWGIMAIGALLMMGLFTRLACVLGGAFLVMTYLAHPPFPWLPLPPGTEGNPVFVNKNVIEFLGLMVVLVHPTGRWMGLDAIIHRLAFPNAPDTK